ncbi:MAG TPA: methyltransferase domain-containing protein, partial [Pyrinomonadaceae bacterium]
MQFCHICGGDLIPRFADVADAQTGEKFSVFACGRCGAAQTFPTPEKLDKYYVDYHGRRHGFTADYCARRRLRWLEKSFDSGKKAKRLLDVGCGEGTFLAAAKKHGWQAVGTETVAENFRDSDLEVFSDFAGVKAKYGAESFDAITMWHTLEHFQMPREALRQVFELLAPKGVLLVAVPDARGWQALASGKYWLHLDVPRHLFHFG